MRRPQKARSTSSDDGARLGPEPTQQHSQKKTIAQKHDELKPAPVNQGRHAAQCSICNHEQREEIEQEFVTWRSPDKIAAAYAICRDSIYRHAKALDLLEPRRRNVRYALERMIERAGDVEVNAGAIVSAIATYSKLNANGQWIDRRETIDLNDLFSKMSEAEMNRYAIRGELPDWFTESVGATPTDSQGVENAD